MQTLERFWHWHRNETPTPDLSAKLLQKNLSDLGKGALALAMRHIAERARPRGPEDWVPLLPALERLSLCYARGLAEMHEAVEEK